MSLHLDRIDLATTAIAANPYLAGPYAPTQDEVTLEDLEVVGEIPTTSTASTCATARTRSSSRSGRYHWFDGDGMVHAVHFADGQRHLPQPLGPHRRLRARARGRRAALARDHRAVRPTTRPASPRRTPPTPTLVFHNERLLALWYRAGKPYALDPVTLETLGAEDFDGTLRCEVSAHAKVDEHTGELCFFDYGDEAAVHALRRRRRRTASSATSSASTCPGPRLPHDMAITERHSILMDLPLVQRPARRRAPGASSSSSTATCRAASA